jgi:hypothetical protein
MIDFVRDAFCDPQGLSSDSGVSSDESLPVSPTRAGAVEETHSRDRGVTPSAMI